MMLRALAAFPGDTGSIPRTPENPVPSSSLLRHPHTCCIHTETYTHKIKSK